MVSNSTKKKIVIGIVVLGLLGLLVVVGIHLWYTYSSSSTNSSSINRSIANFTEVLDKERIFYLPVLTPTTSTTQPTTSTTTSTTQPTTTTSTTQPTTSTTTTTRQPSTTLAILRNFIAELD